MTGLGTMIVVEIGGTAVKIGFAVAGQPDAFIRTFPTARIREVDPVAALVRLVREASHAAELEPEQAVVTVPGFIDTDFDRVLFAANVPELNGRCLATELSSALGMAVQLERDVVLQLLGECRRGIAAGETHVLGIYFGTGIGAAYLADGTMFRGGGWALELGHVPVHGEGRSLPGLRPDCLEVYASGRTLASFAEVQRLPVGELFSAAPSRPGLQRQLDGLVRDQAFAVASAISMLSPHVVVVGGGVVEMPNYPRDRLRAIIAEHVPLPQSIRSLDIRWAVLGWQAAIWGAIDLTTVRAPEVRLS